MALETHRTGFKSQLALSQTPFQRLRVLSRHQSGRWSVRTKDPSGHVRGTRARSIVR